MTTSVVVSTDDGSQARWLIGRAMEQLQETRRGPQRPLDHLEAARHAQDRIQEAMDLLVLAARAEGRNWSQIGHALQISRQAARQADLRRRAHEQQRQEDFQWRMTPRQRRRRLRWLRRRLKAG